MNRNSEYNQEPVWFCSECLSLAVEYDNEEESYVCNDCGGLNHNKASFENWDDKFVDKYGNHYLCIPNGEFKKMTEWL